MKRNYLTVASFLALMVALPLPFSIAMVFTEQVASFGSQRGADVYLLILRWVRAWTLIGIFTGVIALRLAFGGCGSRLLASVATGTNVLLWVMTLDNFWRGSRHRSFVATSAPLCRWHVLAARSLA